VVILTANRGGPGLSSLSSHSLVPVITACRTIGGGWLRDNHPMVIAGPFVVVLTTAEEQELIARARCGRIEHRDRVRARIVLAGSPRCSSSR
jgi:hypothetical protein